MTKNNLTGLNRSVIDKYYTTENTVKICYDLIMKNLKINKVKDVCIEPSAGNGSFIKYIKLLCNNCNFYDLEPEHKEICKIDYFKFNFNEMIKNQYNKKHVIGNPPFGRQSSLAIKFIKKSAEYADTISFILPKSFKKKSLQKHFPLNFHLICDYELPINSFIVDNKEHNVPCVFQIWIKKKNNRAITDKVMPKNFKFVKKEEPHDISFRRVGVYAGKIDKNTQDKSFQSHYFIKFDILLTEELFLKISKIVYSGCNNTVAAKSISKGEIIEEFNKIL